MEQKETGFAAAVRADKEASVDRADTFIEDGASQAERKAYRDQSRDLAHKITAMANALIGKASKWEREMSEESYRHPFDARSTKKMIQEMESCERTLRGIK